MDKFFRSGRDRPESDDDNRFVVEALEKNKQEGLRQTIQARFLILAILGLLIVTRIPFPESGYYLLFVAAFALVGWAQLHFGQIGYRRVVTVALMLDAVLLTYMMLGPNPWINRNGRQRPSTNSVAGDIYLCFWQRRRSAIPGE